MSKDYEVYLKDIIDAIEKIDRYTRGLSLEQFVRDNLVSDAVIRNLEIIGEAAKRLPEDVKKKYPSVEWKKITGLRDVLAHEYAGVSLPIVWDVVENKLPELKRTLESRVNK